MGIGIETKELGDFGADSVHVHMNTFDYDKLIARIIKHTGAEDTELTTVMIAKIFKDLAVVFNNNKRKNLTPEELKVGETFTKSMAGLRFSDYEDEEASEYYAALAESVEWSLQNFQEILTGTIDTDEVSDEAKSFHDALLDLMDIESLQDDEDGERAMAVMDRLQEIVSDYVTGDFDELQLAIMAEMESALLDDEMITALSVSENAGKVVKYGDSLVTFPIILIKATGNGH